MKRSSIKGRAQPMRHGKPLRRARLIVQWRPDQVPTAMRHQVLVRDGYRCVCCGEQLDLDHWECHHRLLKSRGGRHHLANLIALKPEHHAKWHRQHALEGTRRGLLVPSWADPSRTPVLRHGVRYEQPDDGWRAADPAEWQLEVA